MAGGFTRKTRIVRVSDAKPGDPPSDKFVDIEILEALAFRKANGQEVILDFKKGNVAPVRIDNTGDGNARTAAKGTRRTHMQRIVNPADPTQYFDAEVLDNISFRDIQGNEWILSTPSKNSKPFDVTDGTGDKNSTRRTHNEKKSADLTDKKPSQYLTVERTDMVSFRTTRGEEVILKMPSNDDPTNTNPRANTKTTPDGYVPGSDSVIPPPPGTDDPHIYAFFPPGADGIFTGDAKISQGMLWWIRNVSSASLLGVQVDIKRTNATSPEFPQQNSGSNAYGLGLDSNFQLTAPDIEADLTATATPARASTLAKTMPTAATIKPPIDTKKDLYWMAHPNTNGNTPWTVLLWFNVAKIRKQLGTGSSVQVKILLPALGSKTPPPQGVVGHYVWVTSATFPFTFTQTITTNFPAGGPSAIFPDGTPPHTETGSSQGGEPDTTFTPWPLPTKDTAFLSASAVLGTDDGFGNQIISFEGGVEGFGYETNQYLGTYQDFRITDLASLANASGSAIFSDNGFTPVDFPGSNPSGAQFGFASAAGAAAWAAALNAGQIAGNAKNLYGTRPFPQFGDPPGVTRTLTVSGDPANGCYTYTPFDIIYSDVTAPPAPKAATIKVTGALFHSSAFKYDANNQPGYKLPTAVGSFASDSLSIDETDTDPLVITVTLDAKNKVTVTHGPT